MYEGESMTDQFARLANHIWDNQNNTALVFILIDFKYFLDATFSRNLYFTDQGSPSVVIVTRKKRQVSPVDSDPYPKIAVTDLDGQQEQTLTKENVETPTAIVVNPRTG